MANCGLLLNDGSSFVLLNDGSSFLLLNDNTCDFEPGQEPTPEPEPTPQAQPAAAPDRGFDEFMEAFARSRETERRGREDEELLRILQFEEEFTASIIRKLCGGGDADKN